MPKVPESTQGRVGLPMAPSTGALLPLSTAGRSGEAVQGFGAAATDETNSVLAAEARLNSSRDAVERARDFGRFSEEAASELRRLETEDDLSKPDTLAKYGRTVSSKIKEISASHQGSAESRAALMARLEDQKHKILGDAAAVASKARQKIVTGSLDKTMGALAAQAFEAPSALGFMWSSWDETVNDMAPALGPEMTESFRRSGRQEITKSAIQSLLDRGGAEEADRILKETPGIAEAMSPETRRSFDSAITVARVKAAKEKRENLFGGGATGRALEIMTDNAQAFSAGLLSPQDERMFIAAVTHYQQPTMRGFDPVTGKPIFGAPQIPPFVAEALRARGAGAGSVTGQPQPAQQGRPQQPQPSSGGGQPRQPSQQPGAPRPTPRTPSAPQPGNESETIWNMTGLVAGPVPWAANAASRTPVVGDMMQFPQMTTARATVENLSRDLINVSRNNPRFSEGERKSLEKEIEIRPEFFDTPASLRQRIIGIDNALAERQKNFAKVVSGESAASTEDRRMALDMLRAIVAFREKLGLPPRLKKIEEREALPDGAEYIDPTGVVRRKGGAAAN